MHRNNLSSEIIAEYSNGGNITVYKSIDNTSEDYKRIFSCATFFASQGKKVIITPKLNAPKKNHAYNLIYGNLRGTKFYGKCPDFSVDGFFYEHEGYVNKNPKTNLSNMLHRGLKQSNRVIIEDCSLTDGYIKRTILARIAAKQDIKEVYVKSGENLRLLFKAE